MLEPALNGSFLGAIDGRPPGRGGRYQLCNGRGPTGHSCWNFTAEFSAEFNDAHRWVLNTSQDMLAKLPKKGPTVSDDTILSLSCYATDSGPRESARHSE